MAIVAAFVAAFVSRTVDAGWIASIALGGLLGVSVFLWATDPSKSWGDLAAGIMVSVVVAIAVVAVQKDLDDRAMRLDEGRDRRAQRRDEIRQRASDEQAFRLALGQQQDLRGIDLRRRTLRGFFLARKNLAEANLDAADLTAASLTAANLSRISAVGAKFDRANLTCANLRSGRFSNADAVTGTPATSRASFQKATLSAADLRGAVFVEVDFRDADLTGADLRGAVFHQADFTGADLELADLSGSDLSSAPTLRDASLFGAIYTSDTRWPGNIDRPDAYFVRRSSRRAREDARRRLEADGITPPPQRRCS